MLMIIFDLLQAKFSNNHNWIRQSTNQLVEITQTQEIVQYSRK